jgi:hypothetical protein
VVDPGVSGISESAEVVADSGREFVGVTEFEYGVLEGLTDTLFPSVYTDVRFRFADLGESEDIGDPGEFGDPGVAGAGDLDVVSLEGTESSELPESEASGAPFVEDIFGSPEPVELFPEPVDRSAGLRRPAATVGKIGRERVEERRSRVRVIPSEIPEAEFTSVFILKDLRNRFRKK